MEELPPSKPAKRKVMIYVPEGIARAMGILAIERDCSVSDLYVEAARALLEPGQVTKHASSDPADSIPAPSGIGSPHDAVLAEILKRLEDLKHDRATAPATDAGQMMARAMAVTLSSLARAGDEGLGRYVMMNTLKYEGFPDDLGPVVVARLREYGLVAGKNIKLTLRTPKDTVTFKSK